MHGNLTTGEREVAVTIELDSDVVQPGGTLTGRLVGDDGMPREHDVVLVRGEDGLGNKRDLKSTRVVTRSDPATGAFSLIVPKTALPNVVGRRVKLAWNIRVDRGALGALRATELRPIQVVPSDVTRPPLPLRYEPGQPPRMLTKLRREHYLSTFMGIAFTAMCIAFIVVINGPDSEASARATRNISIAVAIVALFPLTATFLAARTIWPKKPKGFDLQLSPAVARSGDTITVSSTDPWPDDLRFLCVETYNRIYYKERTGLRRQMGQFDTYEHSEHRLRSDAGSCSFEIPEDAAASYDGDQIQVKWVLRRGGRKVLRWGPIKLREWSIVVVP